MDNFSPHAKISGVNLVKSFQLYKLLMRNITATLLLMSLVWLNLAQAADPIQHRVLIQVSEDSIDRLKQALGNASNIIQDFGPHNVDIQIVVLGAGVNTLRLNAPFPVPDKVRVLKSQGVRILLDLGAMQKAQLKPADMLTEVRYVESGLVEILEKQYQGWAYVRP